MDFSTKIPNPGITLKNIHLSLKKNFKATHNSYFVTWTLIGFYFPGLAMTSRDPRQRNAPTLKNKLVELEVFF